MPPRAIAPWKLVLAYVAFGLFAFFVFFYLTFPYSAIGERITAEAAAQGYAVEMGSLGPGLFGVTARDLSVRNQRPPAGPDEVPPAQPLRIESLALRPSVFPIGVAFRASLLDGTLSGSLGNVGDLSLHVEADGLQLASPDLKAFTGMDLSGTLEGELSLEVPKSAPVGPNPRGGPEPDFGQANGSLTLDGNDILVNGGTITVPMGGQPTPLDLPRIAFGDLDGDIEFEKGVGTVKTLAAKGPDLDLQGSGTVKLARRVEFSELNLEVRIKLEQDFQKRLGMVAAGLTVLQPDRRDPQYRIAKVTGFLGRPTFR